MIKIAEGITSERLKNNKFLTDEFGKAFIAAYERYISLPDTHPLKAKYKAEVVQQAYGALFPKT